MRQCLSFRLYSDDQKDFHLTNLQRQRTLTRLCIERRLIWNTSNCWTRLQCVRRAQVCCGPCLVSGYLTGISNQKSKAFVFERLATNAIIIEILDSDIRAGWTLISRWPRVQSTGRTLGVIHSVLLGPLLLRWKASFVYTFNDSSSLSKSEVQGLT